MAKEAVSCIRSKCFSFENIDCVFYGFTEQLQHFTHLSAGGIEAVKE